MQKKILMIHTGGTIAMSEDKTTGKVGHLSSNPLNETAGIFSQFADLTIENIFHLPSPHMTIDHMFLLSQFINDHYEDFDGIVITHGTDTLEETAYFLELTCDLPIPIVMTGAMRSSDEIGSDGLSNLRSALFVALSDQSAKAGVLVVMNDEIHSATYVTKTHTTNLATFQTPTFGPLGLVVKDQVIYFQKLVRQEHYAIFTVEPRVALLKAYAGMDDSLFAIVDQVGYDGLVIEGLGAGNLPPQTVSAVGRLIAKHVPIVMVSRAFNGVTEDVYDYPGGGKQLHQMGVIFTQGLTGVKARIKLIVLLASGVPKDELIDYFQL